MQALNLWDRRHRPDSLAANDCLWGFRPAYVLPRHHPLPAAHSRQEGEFCDHCGRARGRQIDLQQLVSNALALSERYIAHTVVIIWIMLGLMMTAQVRVGKRACLSGS